MNDATKRKQEEVGKERSSKKVVGAVGVVESPGQLDAELDETKKYWSEAVSELRGEKFNSLEQAVERVVQLAADKLGSAAASTQTQTFMKEALLSSEEVMETLRDTLDIEA